MEHIWFWVNYNDLTATSLEIIGNKGNHPQMALIQVSEILKFAQMILKNQENQKKCVLTSFLIFLISRNHQKTSVCWFSLKSIIRCFFFTCQVRVAWWFIGHETALFDGMGDWSRFPSKLPSSNQTWRAGTYIHIYIYILYNYIYICIHISSKIQL